MTGPGNTSTHCAERSTMTPIDLPDSSPPRVLIVDDTPDNLHLLAAVLADDYDVLVATDGQSALERVHGEPLLDLVLLDVHMPGLDGYEVCRRIREGAASRHLPVIFVTAADDAQAQTRGFALGAVDFIVRPFSVPVVCARVRTHVELKRRGAAGEWSAMSGLIDDEFLAEVAVVGEPHEIPQQLRRREPGSSGDGRYAHLSKLRQAVAESRASA